MPETWITCLQNTLSGGASSCKVLPTDEKNEGGGKSKLEIGFETMILTFEHPMAVLT